MNSLKWSLFFLFGEFNPLACLISHVSWEGSVASVSSHHRFLVYFPLRCHPGCGQAKPAQLGDQFQMEWKVFCMAAPDPADLLYLFRAGLPQLLPHLLTYISSGFPAFVPSLQDPCSHLGSAAAALLLGPRKSLCRPYSSTIFSCNMTGVLLAGKEARSKCASSPRAPCTTGVVLAKDFTERMLSCRDLKLYFQDWKC